MKKLFALVLSLALVVAFAVPALASGWAQLDWQIPVYKDISLTLTGLDLVQNTAAVGSLFAPLSTYYPVVKHSRVHFYAEVTLPDANDLSPAMKRLLADWALDLDIAVSGITLDDTFTQYKDKAFAGTFNVANYGKVKQGFTVSLAPLNTPRAARPFGVMSAGVPSMPTVRMLLSTLPSASTIGSRMASW